ncbi:MAG: Hsp20/alpha crystallin family protein [Desulfobacula sp.]|uniref:Hsp20/alpha crystallin family protein n=1 Tax=Desulfobacula sp. TaxID=2593537 RepID=UPI0025BE794F|nr:Hsp20/alpha crystallin family protein [Desulfobacula sp.]MCD4722066.1 Hsp20/alpha crystallin family protein [Desulfobacula sp.]
MRLVRYNPINELAFWGNAFNDSFFNTKPKTNESWYPAVDILNEKDDVVLNIELPGVKKENISINIEDRVLTIKGERKFENKEKKDSYLRKERSYGSFKRSFTLSDDVLIDEVNADFQDGVLKLTLKKDTAKEEVKQITIN